MGRILELIWVGAISVPYLVLWPDVLLPLADKALPGDVWRGPDSLHAIALTFDDGPDPTYTPQVLDILRRNGIRATFFLVGEQARKHPELLAAIRQDGHVIGSHGDTWQSTRSLSPDEFEMNLLRVEATLGLQGVSPKFFRPAGGVIGKKAARIARQHGYIIVLASALPFDPYRPSAYWITLLVRRSLAPGAIVVLHDAGGDRTRTVEALPRIIEAARDRGLGFVTIPEMR